MKRELFENFIKAHEAEINEIRDAACSLHESVGQTYDKVLPYGHHLNMVADAAMRFGHNVVEKEEDILPLIFGAYYHDSIEDARLTYGSLTEIAEKFLTSEQAFVAAEIVYALTNDKGRTRKERAGERYYAGIRETPFAPFVKLCDRYANMTYSFKSANNSNNHMRHVYQDEWPHFIEAINPHNHGIRFTLPVEIIQEIENQLER